MPTVGEALGNIVKAPIEIVGGVVGFAAGNIEIFLGLALAVLIGYALYKVYEWLKPSLGTTWCYIKCIVSDPVSAFSGGCVSCTTNIPSGALELPGVFTNSNSAAWQYVWPMVNLVGADYGLVPTNIGTGPGGTPVEPSNATLWVYAGNLLSPWYSADGTSWVDTKKALQRNSDGSVSLADPDSSNKDQQWTLYQEPNSAFASKGLTTIIRAADVTSPIPEEGALMMLTNSQDFGVQGVSSQAGSVIYWKPMPAIVR